MDETPRLGGPTVAASQDAVARALKEKTAMCGLSNEVKAWISVPVQSEERVKLSKELEVVESMLFEKQRLASIVVEKLATIRSHIRATNDDRTRATLQKEIDALPAQSEMLKEIEELEADRGKLLNEYWTKYFQSEWPHVSQGAAMIRRTMTSPSSYFAAENMLAMRASGPQGGNGRVDAGSTSPSNMKRAPKRIFDSFQNGNSMPFPASVQIGSHGISSGYPSQAYSQSDDGWPSANKQARPDDGSVRCNCKKSRCLKLYCECFAARKNCVDDCKCVDCANNEAHHEARDASIRAVLERRPDAFHTKILVAAVVNGAASQAIAAGATPAAAAALAFRDGQQPVALAHVRGCSCRRTKCTKKYCVCYNTEVKCGEWCRCTGCENGKVDSGTSQDSSEPVSSQGSSQDRLAILATLAS